MIVKPINLSDFEITNPKLGAHFGASLDYEAFGNALIAFGQAIVNRRLHVQVAHDKTTMAMENFTTYVLHLEYVITNTL